MSFSIGRFGTDTTLRNPSSIKRSGNEVTVEGWVITTSATLQAALIQQLNGLMDNPDEPIVPWVYSYDTSWQGYYEVLGVEHELEPQAATNFQFSYRIQLKMVSGYTLPEVETIAVGAARSGKPGGVTQVYWTAIPDTVKAWSIASTNIAAATSTNRNYSATHHIDYFQHNDLLTYAPSMIFDPTNYYDASCYMKLGSDGLYSIGRQSQNAPANWTIGNELLTVTAPTSNSYACKIIGRKLDGSAATQSYHLELGYVTAGPTWNTFNFYGQFGNNGTPALFTTLRNSPEEVSARLTWGSAVGYRVSLDISFRRGERGARFYWNANNQSNAWGMGWRERASFTAIDVNNRGMYETSSDTDGLQRIIIANGAVTLSTANGFLYGGTGTQAEAWLGYTPLPTTAYEGYVALQDQWFAAMAEKQRVVPR